MFKSNRILLDSKNKVECKNKFEKLKCILCNQLIDQKDDHKCDNRTDSDIKVTRR